PELLSRTGDHRDSGLPEVTHIRDGEVTHDVSTTSADRLGHGPEVLRRIDVALIVEQEAGVNGVAQGRLERVQLFGPGGFIPGPATSGDDILQLTGQGTQVLLRG